MPWYQGYGPADERVSVKDATLKGALSSIVDIKCESNAALRLPVLEVQQTNETVIVGRVQTGVLKPGMKIRFAPSNITAKVNEN